MLVETKPNRSIELMLKYYKLDFIQILNANKFYHNLITELPPICKQIIVKHISWIFNYSNNNLNQKRSKLSSSPNRSTVPLATLEPDFYQSIDFSKEFSDYKYLKHENIPFLVALTLNEFKNLLKSK